MATPDDAPAAVGLGRGSPTGPVLPELRVWRALRRELAQGRPAVLVVVVAHTGSSPGRTGWLMAVGRGGWLAGTTGGGAAEAQVVTGAVDLLAEPEPVSRLVTQTHRTGTANASGLLCGGEQVMALIRVTPDSAHALAAVDAALTRGDTVSWTVTPNGWTLGATAADGFLDGRGWAFVQTSGPSHQVVLVGAGHVGSALARVLVPLGFRVRVVDERPGAAVRLADFAHDLVERRYEDVRAVIQPSERTFVVIATHAPDRDAAAVAALADVPLGYFGVLGSQAKLAHLPDVSHLVAPMGLSIGSHTPEEIAVSVAAQLVAVRTRHRGATPRSSV
ncbi:MAG: XdhC family protein [Propionicimonas sp.]